MSLHVHISHTVGNFFEISCISVLVLRIYEYGVSKFSIFCFLLVQTVVKKFPALVQYDTNALSTEFL